MAISTSFGAGVVLNAPAASVILGFFCGLEWELDGVDLVLEHFKVSRVLKVVELFWGERRR